ncbi:MAG: tRNA lysidine(34) synthetase TilS, partial [Planctomycetes bacterium]|nr:tRNA lysidine(34) synthetase TilS [Planctomycetota bacterium]
MQQIHIISEVLQLNLPAAGTPVLIAVSGGCDSMLLLQQLIANGQWPLHVFHLDHQLRDDSNLDAQLVAEYCVEHGVTADIECCDIAEMAVTERKSIETCARDYRYQRMHSLAVERQIQYVLTAHHQDDQVETVLMHIFRGSSVYGHGGMALQRALHDVTVLRPLLDISRADIRKYAKQLFVPWHEDQSNLDRVYRRNYIRHQVIPDFEAACPGFSGELLRWSKDQAQQARELDLFIDRYWLQINQESQIPLTLYGQWNNEQRAALWRRVLMTYKLKISRGHIQRIDALFSQDNNKTFELSHWQFIRRREVIAWRKNTIESAEVCIALPQGESCVHKNHSFRMCEIEVPVDLQSLSTDEAVVDRDKLIGDLCLRSIKQGEVWRALAAPGHKKIRKYLADKHLSVDQRQDFVIIADQAGPIW